MYRSMTTSLGIACVLFFSFLAAPTALAITTTWNGSFDNDWTNGSNWSAGVPGAVDDAIIGGAANLTIINVPASALNSLTVNAAGAVTLLTPGPATLTLTGALTVTSSLTIGNNLNITAGGGGSVAMGASLSFSGGAGNNLTNNGVFTVNGTIHILGFASNASVSGNDLTYTVGSLLLYQYGVGGGAPATGAELPSLPNVMNGDVTIDVPIAISYKMNGNKQIAGTFTLTQGGWNIQGNSFQLDGAISIQPINTVFAAFGAAGVTIGGSGAIIGSMQFQGGSSLQDLTMSRAGATLLISSIFALPITGTLNLFSGKIDCATNNTTLNVTNTAATAVTGGSPISYVITSASGYLQREIPNGTPGGNYLFPIGTATGYLGYAAVNPTFVTSGPAYIYAYAVDVTPSSPIASAQVVYQRPSGMITSANAGIRLYSSSVSTGVNVATGSAQLPLSAYSPLTNNALIFGQFVESAPVLLDMTTQWLGLTGTPTPPYVWSGAPGANWQTPSSWTPPRNAPATTDELIFNAGTHTPTNVPHETISKLTIKNGATVTLSASNPTNWLTTTAFPDGVLIESGGKLDLGAPATNIALNMAVMSQCRVQGTLQTQNSAVIGAGHFQLDPDALLATSRDDGINGASVSGGAIQTATANYGFQGRFEFTSASPGAERDMNFKQQGGKNNIFTIRALYVGASAGTRRLNSSILLSGSTAEVVIKGRTTLYSSLGSSIILDNPGIVVTVQDGAELWNNGQINFAAACPMNIINGFLTMVGPNGGGGSGTGVMTYSGSTINYSGSSMLSYTGGGSFTTDDLIVPPTMPVQVSVSNASIVALNSSKTFQAALHLSSGGKLALNDQNLALNGLNTNTGGAFRGATLSALTLNGAVNGNIAFENGFGRLNTLTLNHAQTPVPALAGTLDILNTLSLQSGILTIAAPNILTLSNPFPSSLAGGSAASYIRGALRRTMQANISTDGQSYVFPVGDNIYRPFTLANVRTGALSPTIQGQSFASGANSWTAPLTSGAPYNWLAQSIRGNFLTGTFQTGSPQNPVTLGLRVATASAQSGPYGDIGADETSPTRSALPQAATVSNSGTYFALGGAVPSLISFTPRTARPGQTVSITGLFLSSVTGVSFGGAPAANFTIVSPTQITAVVGSVGASGSVQAQSPLGAAVAPLPFTWTGQPTITAVSPSLNVVGQIITIRGTEYHTTPGVSIGTQSATSITAASLTELRVVFAQATTGILTIIASGGTVSWQQPLTVFAAPTITTISTIQPLPGALFTVMGTNFAQGLTQVSIGGVPVQATVNSPTQITIVAPQSANAPIRIVTPAGTVFSTQTIVVIPPPTIASATPTAPQVGDPISIVGTNYINVQNVSIGGIPMTFVVNSPTSITAITPPFATQTSTASITVTTRTGTAVYARPLMLQQPPEPVMTLTGFSPSVVVEGQTLTVTGLNVPNTAAMRLRSAFGNVLVSNAVVSNSATQTAANSTSSITLTVPSGLIPPTMASTLATITAEAIFPSGAKTAQAALPLTIRAADAPQLVGFSPNTGGARTSLVILGQNFGVSTRSTIQDVLIGGAPVQAFVVLSPTEIRVLVGQVTSGTLSIQTGSGLLTTSATFTFNPLLDVEPVAVSDSLALNALYAATKGALWTTSTNWTNGSPVALRFGVKVERGRVVELRLPANNLDSTLPWAALANLTALRTLNIAGNSLIGSIPTNVCAMASLKTLDLSGNRFQGGAEALCCLPVGLESLNISNNRLAGFLPECLKQVSALQTFDASGNQFLGGFPSFLVQMPQLRVLNLRRNRLTGALPPSIGESPSLLALGVEKGAHTSSVEGLQRLDIGGNGFVGELPAELGNLRNMNELILDSNRFTGSVPASLVNMRSLRNLNLADNVLQRIPDLTRSVSRLQSLDVRGNSFPLADLEVYGAVPNFAYAPQNITPPRLADTVVVVDTRFVLRAPLAGLFNRYSWRKNAAFVRDAAVADSLEFPAFAASDSALYSCHITNTRLPLLTVTTANVRVQAVLPPNVPDSLRLITPVVGETDVPTLPNLVWTSVQGAGQYRLEVSAQPNFTPLLTALTVAQSSSALASGRVDVDTRGASGFPLQAQQRYFWRVRAENARGAGIWTNGDFTTAANSVLGAQRLDFGKIPRGDTTFAILSLRNLSETRIRLADGITTSHPSFICEDVRGREIPAGAVLAVRVRFTPTTLETVNAALTLRFTAEGSTQVQTQTTSARLFGRGGALKLLPPAIDTSLIGMTKLLAVQVVNVGDRPTELVRVDLRRGAREYSFRAEVDGKAPLGAGDTTAVLLKFVAERINTAAQEIIYCQATVDTITAPLTQFGRTRKPSDVVAKLGLRAIPESAPPGSAVMLEIYLAGTNADDRARLFQSGIPFFTASLQLDRNVLAISAAGQAFMRPLRNTAPQNSTQRYAVPTTFWNGRDSVLLRVSCVAVAGSTDATKLVLEQLQWGDGTLQVADVIEGRFVARTSQAGGKRLITTESKVIQILRLAPNPSADVLDVSYQLVSPAPVAMSLVDMRGATVQTFAPTVETAGDHVRRVSVAHLPTGTYTLRIESAGAVLVRRVEIVR